MLSGHPKFRQYHQFLGTNFSLNEQSNTIKIDGQNERMRWSTFRKKK